MRILVTGSRDWPRERATEVRDAVLAEVGELPPDSVTVVHGACEDIRTGMMCGADAWAHLTATHYGFNPESYPADWRRYGRAAGMIRNREMVALGADVVLAFPLGRSPGTRGCIREAQKAGLVVKVHEGLVAL